MKNLLPPVTGAMAVLLLALAAFLIRQNGVIDQLRARGATERTTFTQLYDKMQRAAQEKERELRDARDTIAQLQRELAVARAAAGLDTDHERNGTDPAVLEFRRRQQRRIVQERYGDLFQRLSLSAESLEEFKNLLIELEDPTVPSASAAPAANGESTIAPVEPTHRSTAAIHEEIYYLLGYEDYTAFDRYGRELTSVRPLVRRFANDAADAGIPLTAVQSAALSRVIFEVIDPQTNADAVKPGANVADSATGLTPLDELVLTRATEVLSRPQLDLLKAFRIHEREGLAAWRNSLTPAETPAVAAPAPSPAP